MNTQRPSLRLNRFEFSALLALLFILLSLVISSITSFASECEHIRSNTIRLHVVAHSDSDEDQQLKLAVRDAILEKYAAALLGEQKDAALAQTSSLLRDIEHTANTLLLESGFDGGVQAELVKMYFQTTHYENLTMPAGVYDALRITIGDAAGHNWWCVMFPPLCLPAASENSYASKAYLDKELEKHFGATSAELVKNPAKYEIRFALLELIERWLHGKQ
ncbi:MAG: stage II sporulation protein R [Ruminococcaceae bacterium]|nr:stage II sporulation protein R [Oscillospiraceae bacterium]